MRLSGGVTGGIPEEEARRENLRRFKVVDELRESARTLSEHTKAESYHGSFTLEQGMWSTMRYPKGQRWKENTRQVFTRTKGSCTTRGDRLRYIKTNILIYVLNKQKPRCVSSLSLSGQRNHNVTSINHTPGNTSHLKMHINSF